MAARGKETSSQERGWMLTWLAGRGDSLKASVSKTRSSWFGADGASACVASSQMQRVPIPYLLPN